MTIDQLINDLKKYRAAHGGDVPIYTTTGYDEVEVSGIKFLIKEKATSICCRFEMPDYPDSDLCPFCKEHTDVEQLPDRIYLKI